MIFLQNILDEILHLSNPLIELMIDILCLIMAQKQRKYIIVEQAAKMLERKLPQLLKSKKQISTKASLRTC